MEKLSTKGHEDFTKERKVTLAVIEKVMRGAQASLLA